MPPDPPAPEPDPPEPGQADDRLGERVDGLEAKVDKILGIISGGSDKPASEPGQPQQPANVAEEIRRQIEDRDAKAASAAEEQAKTDRIGALETKITELAEHAPEPMPRRVEKFMGWR